MSVYAPITNIAHLHLHHPHMRVCTRVNSAQAQAQAALADLGQRVHTKLADSRTRRSSSDGQGMQPQPMRQAPIASRLYSRLQGLSVAVNQAGAIREVPSILCVTFSANTNPAGWLNSSAIFSALVPIAAVRPHSCCTHAPPTAKCNPLSRIHLLTRQLAAHSLLLRFCLVGAIPSFLAQALIDRTQGF